MSAELLAAVLEAQDRDDASLQHPNLERYARRLQAFAAGLDEPLLAGVGSGGFKLLGALEVLSRGAFDIAGWNSDPQGRTIVLVATHVAATVEIQQMAAQWKSRGASSVHAWMIGAAVIADHPELDEITVVGREHPVAV